MAVYRRGLCAVALLMVGVHGFARAGTMLPPPVSWAALSLRYVANAGVLVTIGDAKVLIDAPIREGIPPYTTSSPAERTRLEGAMPPYDDIDAVLITHWHEDHFSAEAAAAHLGRNLRAVLVSSPEVVDRVRAAAPRMPADRFRAVLPEPGASQVVAIGNLPVRILRLRHSAARRFPEQHVGFLLGENPAVLHTGDADPKPDNFAVLRKLPRVNVALVPFWFLLGDANRTFVIESIAPDRMIAMHLPLQDAAEVSRKFAEAKVRATLLVTPGTIVN